MKQNGFTLIELLVTISLIGLIMTVVMLYFRTITKNYLTTKDLTQMKQQGNYALEMISRTIMSASQIKDSSGRVIDTISCNSGLTSFDTLTIATPKGSLTSLTCQTPSSIMMKALAADGITVLNTYQFIDPNLNFHFTHCGFYCQDRKTFSFGLSLSSLSSSMDFATTVTARNIR